MTEKHTPTPWSYIGDDDGDFVIFGGPDKGDDYIANIGNTRLQTMDIGEGTVAFDVDQANARYIVKCVNSHEKLVDTLEFLARLPRYQKFLGTDLLDMIKRVLADVQAR